jgi:hypothetical protein
LGRIFIVKRRNIPIINANTEPITYHYELKCMWTPKGRKRIDEINALSFSTDACLSFEDALKQARDVRKTLHEGLTETQIAFREMAGTL